MKRLWILLCLLLLLLGCGGQAADGTITYVPSETAGRPGQVTAAATAAPLFTAAPTFTPTPEPTATPEPTPTPEPTATPAPTPTVATLTLTIPLEAVWWFSASSSSVTVFSLVSSPAILK